MNIVNSFKILINLTMNENVWKAFEYSLDLIVRFAFNFEQQNSETLSIWSLGLLKKTSDTILLKPLNSFPSHINIIKKRKKNFWNPFHG